MIEQISTNAINALRSINVNHTEKTASEITKSFGEYLNNALNEVSALEADVHKKNDLYLAGQVDATEVLIAASQSQLSLQLTSEIRNKAVAAYQEIMRIQI